MIEKFKVPNTEELRVQNLTNHTVLMSKVT